MAKHAVKIEVIAPLFVYDRITDDEVELTNGFLCIRLKIGGSMSRRLGPTLRPTRKKLSAEELSPYIVFCSSLWSMSQ